MKVSLTPCRIGSCIIQNRFVMTAANLGWCDGGYVNDKVTAFYKERVKGGAGLIIAGAAGVDPARVNRLGMMQIYDDCFIPAMRKMTDEIHEAGGKIFLQLMHAGAYARGAEHNGAAAVAPSAYMCRFTREETKELSAEEITEIISCFGEAAGRAKRAGFDGVELIGSAGYLIAEFLSKSTNHRTDEYGGDIRKRSRFLLESIKEVRKAVGEEFPVIVRLSGTDFVPGGNGPEEFVEVGRLIEKEVDAIDVTGGWHESQVPQITYHVPRGEYLYLAKAMKEAVSIPVIGCNRLDAKTADEAIENGFCDMAGILRGQIADPFMVRKFEQDNPGRIRPCLACNQDCLGRIFSGKDLRCVVNPYAGRELFKREPSVKGKTIMVVGAGISGMAYALMMASDNKVIVREKTGSYGGAANAVARIPYREDVGDYVEYLFRECLYAGVQFEWFWEASVKELRQELSAGSIDKVVIAKGAHVDRPAFPVEEGARVISAEECIISKNPFGKHIAVIGSGYKAVQTVQYLLSCGEGKKEEAFLNAYGPEYSDFAGKVLGCRKNTVKNTVTMLAEGEKIGNGFGKSLRWLMISQLKKSPVAVITDADIQRIKKDKIIYAVQGEKCELPCDLAVIAQGFRADSEYCELIAAFPGKILCIGDAKRPGRISEAVKDAYEAAFFVA